MLPPRWPTATIPWNATVEQTKIEELVTTLTEEKTLINGKDRCYCKKYLIISKEKVERVGQ